MYLTENTNCVECGEVTKQQIFLGGEICLMCLARALDLMDPDDKLGKTLNDYADEVHKANSRWWIDLHTGQPLKRNVGELLMLVTSELAEAMEGHRKSLPDDKLPHRPMFEVELADAVIRIFDIAAGMKLDLYGAYLEKMAYNAQRADHLTEHRKSEHGKKY
jgi:hypothetical protein